MLHPEDLPPITSTVVPPFVVEEPSQQEPVLAALSIEESRSVTEIADVDEGDGTFRGAESLSRTPSLPTETESGQPSEETSIAAGIAIVAGTILVALLTWIKRRLVKRQVTPVESKEPERVLTRI